MADESQLAHIRRRPAMYLGETGLRGVHTMTVQLIRTAFRSATEARVDSVLVELRSDGSVCIADARTADAEDFGELAANLTRHETGYPSPPARTWSHYTVANALSEWMRVEARSGGRVTRHEFRRGEAISPPAVAPDTGPPGLTAVFKPDPIIFGETPLAAENRVDGMTIRDRLRECACLHSGVRVLWSDRAGGSDEAFECPDGIRSLVEWLDTWYDMQRRRLHPDVIVVRGERDGVRFEAGLRWREGGHEEGYRLIASYANGEKTPNDGTHVTGLTTAITRSLNGFVRRYMPDVRELQGHEFHAGLTAAVSVWLADPVYDGATKWRLANAEARSAIETAVGAHLRDHFAAHPEVAERIIRTALARPHGPAMTDEEWEACADPQRMLELVGPRASRRKLLLFVAACYPLSFRKRVSRQQREVLAAMEAYAVGELDRAEFRATLAQSERVTGLSAVGRSTFSAYDAGWVASFLRAGREATRTQQASFVRDIFGNPNRPLVADPSWRTSTVLALARAIDADRAFENLPILADALQDAGCEDADVLAHCRGDDPHARGCWVVDMLLGFQ